MPGIRNRIMAQAANAYTHGLDELQVGRLVYYFPGHLSAVAEQALHILQVALPAPAGSAEAEVDLRLGTFGKYFLDMLRPFVKIHDFVAYHDITA